ncbi:YceI family protein [Fibrivirga algicola]|uniref:YceI family protein n=1 Tax=Fibrivirga algicola TaxID=2950420 RepID=A0ABX0QLC3_9BACT|nr:YceI family protein [Fibrivirga algicola]NID12931.1 YceI family protein [Fibrivirga algicola]
MAATKWVVDPMHSEVQFKIKHLVISTVTGTFRQFGGGATTEHDDFDGAEVHFELDVNSIDTNQEMRDTHLKSAEFFEAETFPKIAFKSTSFRKIDDDEYTLVGELTMKGVTKPVTLKAEYGGTAKDAYGNQKLGFEVTGKINRKEFGLTYNALTETGGLALGEDIKLIANIQLAQAA